MLYIITTFFIHTITFLQYLQCVGFNYNDFYNKLDSVFGKEILGANATAVPVALATPGAAVIAGPIPLLLRLDELLLLINPDFVRISSIVLHFVSGTQK